MNNYLRGQGISFYFSNMDPEIIKTVAELGPTGAFLIYLYIRNGRAERVLDRINDSLENNNKELNRNTKVLIEVAQKHKLLEKADSLIME